MDGIYDLMREDMNDKLKRTALEMERNRIKNIEDNKKADKKAVTQKYSYEFFNTLSMECQDLMSDFNNKKVELERTIPGQFSEAIKNKTLPNHLRTAIYNQYNAQYDYIEDIKKIIGSCNNLEEAKPIIDELKAKHAKFKSELQVDVKIFYTEYRANIDKLKNPVLEEKNAVSSSLAPEVLANNPNVGMQQQLERALKTIQDLLAGQAEAARLTNEKQQQVERARKEAEDVRQELAQSLEVNNDLCAKLESRDAMIIAKDTNLIIRDTTITELRSTISTLSGTMNDLGQSLTQKIEEANSEHQKFVAEKQKLDNITIRLEEFINNHEDMQDVDHLITILGNQAHSEA